VWQTGKERKQERFNALLDHSGTADCHDPNCPDSNMVRSVAEQSLTNSELRRQRRLERY
jgi:hypothetical protein